MYMASGALREISKVKITIWGVQNMDSPYKLLHIVEMLFQPFQSNNLLW